MAAVSTGTLVGCTSEPSAPRRAHCGSFRPWPVTVRTTVDPAGMTPAAEGFPTTVIYDRKGMERARLSGQYQLTLDTLQAMRQAWSRREEAAQWSLEAAMLLAERFGRDDDARAVLHDALATSEEGEQRRRLEAALSALGSSSPALPAG